MPPRRPSCAWVALLVLALALAARAGTVSVAIDTPWPSSAASLPMLEAEFVARLGSVEAFWGVVQTRSLPQMSEQMMKLLRLHTTTSIHALALEEQRSLAEALRSSLDFADASKCAGHAAFAAVSSAAGTYGVCADAPERVPASCSADSSLLITPSDRVHPRSSSKPDAKIVIVHGELGTPQFNSLVEWAVAQLPEIKLVVRLAVLSAGTGNVRLGGFGATMDVKSTEYVTVDLSATDWKKEADADVVQGVVFSALLARSDVINDADKKKRLSTLHSALRNEQAKGLRTWEMRDLSIQVAMDVLSAKDPLAHLVEVISNIPAHTRRLSQLSVPERFRDQLESKAPGLGSAGAHLLLNGRMLPGLQSTQMDLEGPLLELAKQFSLEAIANALPVSRSDFARALAFTPQATPSWGSRVDVRRLAKGAVVFFNDLEKDESYAPWTTKLDSLRTNPRAFQQVRRNLITFILIVDPSTDDAEEALRIIEYLVMHGAPIRFGVAVTSQELVDKYRAWKDEDECPVDAPHECSVACVAQLIFAARKAHGGHAALAVASALVKARGTLTREAAISYYAESIAEITGAWRSGPYATQAAEALKEEWLAAARMARYVGALRLPLPSFTLNGVVHGGPPTRLDRRLSPLIMEEQLKLASYLESGLLQEEGELLQQILKSAGAIPAHSSTSLIKTLPLDKLRLPKVYCAIAGAKADDEARVTLWLPVGKGDCSAVSAVIELLERDPSAPIRFAVVPREAQASASFFKTVSAACAGGDTAALLELAKSCQADGNDDVADLGLGVELLAQGPLVAVNARLFTAPQSFAVVDLVSLVHDEDAARAKKAAHVASKADDVLRVAVAVGLFSEGDQPLLDYGMYPHFPVPSRANDTEPELTMLIDPLSSTAPRVAQLALVLRDKLGVKIKLALAPDATVQELPSMSYYRYAFAEETVTFAPSSMAQHPLLTLKLSTPPSWIAYPHEMSGRDPDNLILGRALSNATAAAAATTTITATTTTTTTTLVYRLTHVLVDGHATLKTSEPAAGMQLQLVRVNGLLPNSGEVKADTLVMHNLGYFQLKAAPGVWMVHSVSDSPFVTTPTVVVLDQFSATVPTELRAVRSSSPAKPRKHVPSQGETIHVFSLASGALYERFLRIMMLCVRRRTSGRLKFWLLENYMSPPMKRFIGPFAAKHGFDVELVTFKWPEWLRGQSERQRQIWGMKILFLDVLFPLDVHRVIYVDADQIVRADLRELWTMDLQGAPYGFTPFCTSRQETLGFQFWRQGFWKNHLKGKNYHISALFVVDLDLFRSQAIGDQLRASYQSLSADPGSLANLDQDLPNFTQHSIPIFSLPEEWLWCESWCSDESKARAKTLDLCNNPLFKEPKLDMARRVIKGELFEESWDELDAQASEGFVP